MWSVHESKAAARALDRAPREILERYELWRALVRLHGPDGPRGVEGFGDDTMTGEWVGHRSSLLADQWRLTYECRGDVVSVNLLRKLSTVTGNQS